MEPNASTEAPGGGAVPALSKALLYFVNRTKELEWDLATAKREVDISSRNLELKDKAIRDLDLRCSQASETLRRLRWAVGIRNLMEDKTQDPKAKDWLLEGGDASPLAIANQILADLGEANPGDGPF